MLQLRPGTDTALALALMHVIIAEGLYDRAFVAQHTVGFDALQTHVQPYTPVWAAGSRAFLRSALWRWPGAMLRPARP